MSVRRVAPSRTTTPPVPPHGRSGSVHAFPLLLVAGVALAWVGLAVHNIADLPHQTVLSPETLVPTLVWLLLLALWAVPATRRAGLWALLGWAVVNLVGGALSVLPLPVLPFAPEQTARHYAFHGVYAATQIPLLVLAIVAARRGAARTR